MNPKYYLEKLQNFTHRGTATENAHKAAEMIKSEYRKLGLKPHNNSFKTLGNYWVYEFIKHLFLFGSSIFILLDERIPALIFLVIGIILFRGTYLWFDNFFKSISKSISRNVYVEFQPRKKPIQTIVALGHYDTARRSIGLDIIAGFIGKKLKFNTDIDKKMPNLLRGPFFLTNISFLINIVLLVIFPYSSLHILFGIFTASILGLTSFIMLYTMLSPFVPGAFDNGTGAAIVMSLASYFKQHKLNNTRLILLNNGSEENITHGFDEFFKEASIDKETTYFINFEGVGAPKPLIAHGESNTLGTSSQYNKKLVNLIWALAKEKEEFSSFEDYYLAVPTDCSELTGKGYKVATTISSLEEDGYYAHYHCMSDTLDKIHFKTMNLARDLVIYLIEEMDEIDLNKLTEG